jgi:hypothetical protein
MVFLVLLPSQHLGQRTRRGEREGREEDLRDEGHLVIPSPELLLGI